MLNRIKKYFTKEILYTKNRLVILNEDSFEEIFSLRLTLMNVFVVGSIAAILIITIVALAHNPLPYSIDWTNPNLITTDNTWSVSNALGVRGYSGSDIAAGPGTDARTVLGESAVLNVKANQTNPNDSVIETDPGERTWKQEIVEHQSKAFDFATR